MTTRLQFQTLAVLSVESDLIRFSVLSSVDGHEVAASTKRLTLITASQSAPVVTDCRDDNDGELRNDDILMTNCSTIASVRPPPTEPGYVEQDPDKIWEAVEHVISDGIDKMCRDGTPVTYIKSIALTNEMGTLMSWDATTGVALHNAIHWTDSRMVESDSGGPGGTASAVEWLIQRSEAVSCSKENSRFGTLDTWLLWKLTGGQTYATDVTNASYTGLLDLATLEWDRDACRAVGLSSRSWPAVRPCSNDRSETAVVVTVGRLLGLSVHATMARPSAVLYGQGCDQRGQVALTLSDRTAVAIGAHVRSVPSAAKWNKTGGALPVVGYCEPDYTGCARKPKVMYGLMTTSAANAIVCWLKNNVSLVASAEECMNAYSSARVPGTQAFMVPALGGLPSAPHRRPEARLVVCGITESMGRVHMITAAVDGMCYNAADMIKCVAAAGSVYVVYVDGWYSEYSAVMQMVADVSGSTVIKRKDDMAVHGVARMAAAIINARYRNVYETLIYRPTIPDEQRATWAKQWRKAVLRSYGWAITDSRKSDDVFTQLQTSRSMITLIRVYVYADDLLRDISNQIISWTIAIYNNLVQIVR